MANSFDLIDAAMEGRLEETLRDLREQGLSIRAIRDHFGAQGFAVGQETIRRWLMRVGLPLKVTA